MYATLIQKFNQLTPLNIEQQSDLKRVLKYEEFPQDSFLLKCGQISSCVHFILSGTVIAIRYSNGKEVIPWFAFEGDFVNSHSSFLDQKPSLESLYTLSDCQLLSITYDSLQYLYSKDSVWNKLFRSVVENYYLEAHERLISLLSQSAMERYIALIQEYPDIENRLKLGHIASFLGITQSTLSRLRARRLRYKLIKKD
jgi:CRP-like cAMP-binding protein